MPNGHGIPCPVPNSRKAPRSTELQDPPTQEWKVLCGLATEWGTEALSKQARTDSLRHDTGTKVGPTRQAGREGWEPLSGPNCGC